MAVHAVSHRVAPEASTSREDTFSDSRASENIRAMITCASCGCQNPTAPPKRRLQGGARYRLRDGPRADDNRLIQLTRLIPVLGGTSTGKRSGGTDDPSVLRAPCEHRLP